MLRTSVNDTCDLPPLLPVADALRLEDTMLERVAGRAGRFGLALWRTGQCLVAPRAMARLPGFEAACASSAARGWPVRLRATGGGIVAQGPGVVNVSIAYAVRSGAGFSMDAAYRRLCEPIVRELERICLACGTGAVAGASCSGRYDISVGGRKLAGTAQRWRPLPGHEGRIAVFSHAMLFVQAPAPAAIAAINRLQESCGAHPPVQPGAHVGLDECLAAGGGPRAFLAALEARYAAALRTLTAPAPVAAGTA